MGITIGEKNQQLLSDGEIRGALNEGLSVRIGAGDTWTFPIKAGTDGCIGKLCVSVSRPVDVAGAANQLAVHVTFTVASIFVPSLMTVRQASTGHRQVDLKIKIQNLHYTARPLSVQKAIVGEKAVAATPSAAEVATHRGIVNKWIHIGNEDRCKAMAAKLEMAGVADGELEGRITAALDAFTGETLTAIKNALTRSLQTEIGENVLPKDLRAAVAVVLEYA